MSGKSDDASKLARANRLRLAAEESARAMEEVTKEAVAVRKNMARLRELRLAKEADAIRQQIPAGNDPPAKQKKANEVREAASIGGLFHFDIR
jgi:hypothetical protein